jgi:hypothetical protein
LSQLQVLQWCRENGCPWDEWSCTYAAQNGHLEVLKWARLNGCPWNEDTCSFAASNGHLEVVKWARDNGCPWNKEKCILYLNDWCMWNQENPKTNEILQWIELNK